MRDCTTCINHTKSYIKEDGIYIICDINKSLLKKPIYNCKNYKNWITTLQRKEK